MCKYFCPITHATEASFSHVSLDASLQIPEHAQPGNYTLKIEGSTLGSNTGNIFENETKIMFSSKQASMFIQTNKPLYKQGQTVYFRVVPVYPNLMPVFGSMDVYAIVSTFAPCVRCHRNRLELDIGCFVGHVLGQRAAAEVWSGQPHESTSKCAKQMYEASQKEKNNLWSKIYLFLFSVCRTQQTQWYEGGCPCRPMQVTPEIGLSVSKIGLLARELCLVHKTRTEDFFREK